MCILERTFVTEIEAVEQEFTILAIKSYSDFVGFVGFCHVVEIGRVCFKQGYP